MNFLDVLVNSYIASVRGPYLTEYMYLVSSFFDISVLSVLVTVAIATLVGIIRGRKYFYFFLVSIYVSAILAYLLKLLFNVARPAGGVMQAFGPSFPSYHAVVATVFFIVLMYIFDGYMTEFWQILFNILCIFCIFLVAFSRVYLGVHWLSDVSCGILIGCLLSYLYVYIFRKINQRVL